MPDLYKKKHDISQEQPPKKRLPLTLWLFYMGILCMSLTGVTFSKYSTVVHGTISVQVAAANTATFLDADGVTEVARFRVYEGQQLTEVPDLNVCEAMLYDEGSMTSSDYIFSDEDTVYRVFLGWSLDGETVIDPMEIEIDQDLVFIAVYEILPEPVELASPSNATPSDAELPDAMPSAGIPSDKTEAMSPSGNAGGTADGDIDAGGVGTAVPQKATPSNAA